MNAGRTRVTPRSQVTGKHLESSPEAERAHTGRSYPAGPQSPGPLGTAAATRPAPAIFDDDLPGSSVPLPLTWVMAWRSGLGGPRQPGLRSALETRAPVTSKAKVGLMVRGTVRSRMGRSRLCGHGAAANVIREWRERVGYPQRCSGLRATQSNRVRRSSGVLPCQNLYFRLSSAALAREGSACPCRSGSTARPWSTAGLSWKS